MYRHEILYQRSLSGMDSPERQSCRSGAFVIISERQRPGQSRPECLAVSALRVPPAIKQPQPAGRPFLSFSNMMLREHSDLGLIKWEERWVTMVFEDI